jgi:anti-sigma-28 factor FlgM
MTLVEAHELKSLVDAGTYKVDPAQIASAMLQRRGIRELLTGLEVPVAQSGQTPPGPVVRPRAA